jgi:16S rRNA (adenine1518-N6/adenine1519-N6)-dimethyltransferase
VPRDREYEMRKKFGQHFLFDKNILRKILKCSDVTEDDTVVEIGPGLGTFTRVIAERARKVIAIEFDKKLIDRLNESVASCSNVEIIRADALKFPYESIKGHFKVVANIPYYITTPLLFKLLEYRDTIPTMTLLMQKEVANRVVASSGSSDYGVLSISAQLYARPVLKFQVSRKVFSPPPDVDSAVVHFEVSPVPLFNIQDVPLFTAIVRAAFSQRRKTIINSLKKFEGIGAALEEAGIHPKLRPERVSIEDFARLTNALKKIMEEAGL